MPAASATERNVSTKWKAQYVDALNARRTRQLAVQWTTGPAIHVAHELEVFSAPPQKQSIDNREQWAIQKPSNHRRAGRCTADIDPSHDVSKRLRCVRSRECHLHIGCSLAERAND